MIPTPVPTASPTHIVIETPKPTPRPTVTTTPLPSSSATSNPTPVPTGIPTPPNSCEENKNLKFSTKANPYVIFELIHIAYKLYVKLDELAKDNPKFFDKAYAELDKAYNYALSVVCGSNDKAQKQAEKQLEKAIKNAEKAIDKSHYVLKKQDIDWRGTGLTIREALPVAFEKTGEPREEFQITKWAKDVYGKSHPVEWKAKGGAEVNIDAPHDGEDTGPNSPHVGWQSSGKKNMGGRIRGHILLDYVPYHR